MSLQKNGNLTQGVLGAFLNTTVVDNPLFPEPSGPNITTNVFNVTSLVNTDIQFRCLDQATAFSGIAHNLFKSVYFYEFNRSYQTPGFSPNVRILTTNDSIIHSSLTPPPIVPHV